MHPRTEAEVPNHVEPSITRAFGSKGGDAGPTATAPPAEPPPPTATPSYAPPPPTPPRRSPRGPGATAGIVLIVIGALFLTGQILPGLAWWSLWPLIIVVAGFVQAFTPGHTGWGIDRLFDGLVTVSFGLVLLGITTGYIGLDVVWQIIKLWPVLLIAIGLDLLGKSMHTSWIRALGSIAVIGALAYAVAVSTGDLSRGFSLTTGTGGSEASISEPVGSVREASLNLKAGVSEVTLDGGDELVEAEGVSPWGEPDFDVKRSGSTAEVDLSLGEANNVVVWPGGSDAWLDARLGRSVLWDIKLETGVSSLEADLSDVPVRKIEMNPGVANCTIRLGPVPSGVTEAQAIVKSGVSSVSLEIPDGVEARVTSDSGLTGHSISDEFDDQGDRVWETDGFDSAKASGSGVWDVTVKSGLGSFSIDTY